LDRCALFVDAGYALGEGALAVHGTRNRDSVSWDYAGLLTLLSSLSRDRSGLPLLRCYWYDVAGAGSRAAEHDALADLPGVKLRLSKARPNRRDGVDAEIRRDLTALARNRSVSDVIVVSAEEDLGSVIAEVQEFGVRVLLLHIGTDGSWASARALRQECDEVVEISPSHLRPYVDLIAGAEPRVPAVGYRELPAAAASASGPHAVPETTGSQLFDSPGPGGYERAAQLANLGSQSQDPRSLLPGTERTAAMHEGQAPQPQRGQAALGQPQPGQPQPTAPYRQSEVGGLGATADASFGQAAFARTDNGHSANGHGAPREAQDFSQRGMTAGGRGHGGQVPPDGADQQAMGQPLASAGLGAHALPGSGVPDGLAGLPGNGVPAGGSRANGVPASGVPLNGVPVNGVPGNGMSAHGLPGSGLPAHGQPGSGLLPGEPARPMQPGGTSQGGPVGGQLGAPPGGPQHQLPGQPYPSPEPFPPAGPGHAGQHLTGQPFTGQQQPGQHPQSLSQMHPAAPDLPPAASDLPPSAPAGLGGGQHSGRGLSGPQNGLVPLDPQRPPLPQRQLPAGNGLPYGQDRGAPYPGQPAAPQFGGLPSQQPFGSGSYATPPSALPSAQLPVAEAVQAAHAEGYGFGEAVARDAPALWLEAVLARKPRMPSDLEARLLQGSTLPIDSLLHDEVRHALRRGFWDALERSRH